VSTLALVPLVGRVVLISCKYRAFNSRSKSGSSEKFEHLHAHDEDLLGVADDLRDIDGENLFERCSSRKMRIVQGHQNNIWCLLFQCCQID
jgi:hypothetical protein